MHRFVVKEAASLGRYLILCGSHPDRQRLEELKTSIRALRVEPERRVHSYTWFEVSMFLGASQEIY